jgi:peptidoglycan/LPS O-acetylase OafA/YrhL
MIRGLAIALVLLRHSWPSTFGGAGIVGVVCFFGLSGYLITGLLLGDIERYGRVRYGRFYRNRALRLLPALGLLLLVFVTVTLVLDPLHERHVIARTVVVAATYTADLPGFSKGSVAMTHLWTLAIEEQFYLVWPALLLVGVRLRRLGVLMATAGLGLYLLCAATLVVSTPERIYTLPTSWVAVMVMGAVARLHQDKVADILPVGPRQRSILSAAALVLLLGISLVPEAKDWAGTYLVLGPLIGLCVIVLIFHLRTWQTVPGGGFGGAVLYLGTISYAAYLWNYPLSKWIATALGDSPWVGVLVIAATIAAASASWFIVEQPIARWRQSWDRRSLAVVPARAERAMDQVSRPS